LPRKEGASETGGRRSCPQRRGRKAGSGALAGYAIELRVPFAQTIPGFTPDHPMGFEIFWRDVDSDDDPGQGGGNISWASWAQSTTVDCGDPKTSLFNTANWGALIFDKTDFLGPAPTP
jgi:hypothetical protein